MLNIRPAAARQSLPFCPPKGVIIPIPSPPTTTTITTTHPPHPNPTGVYSPRTVVNTPHPAVAAVAATHVAPHRSFVCIRKPVNITAYTGHRIIIIIICTFRSIIIIFFLFFLTPSRFTASFFIHDFLAETPRKSIYIQYFSLLLTKQFDEKFNGTFDLFDVCVPKWNRTETFFSG